MRNEHENNFTWILFDADNTIFDFHASSEIAFHKSFGFHGMTSTDGMYGRFKEINLEAWKAFDQNEMTHEDIKSYRFTRLFEEVEINHIDPLEFNALYFNQLVANIKYVEQAPQTLEFLNKRKQLAIITNGMKEVQRPRLEASDIYHHFDLIFVSGEIGHSKPNHSFFEYVYERLDENDKEKVLVVGDNIFADIKGGKDFGFKTAWYNPHRIVNDNGIQPDFEIQHLDQLKEIIK